MGRSYTDIKYDLWYNLGKIGVSVGNAVLAANSSPGNKIFSFGKKPLVATNVGSVIKHGKRFLNGTTARIGNIDNIIGDHTTPRSFVSFFAPTDFSKTRYIFGGRDKDDGEFDVAILSDSTFRFRVAESTPNAAISSQSLSSGIEYCLINTWNGSSLKNYINGEADGTGTQSGDNSGDLGNLIGGNPDNPTNNNAQGYLRSFFIFNFELSQEQARSFPIDPFKPRPDISYFDQVTQSGLLPIFGNQRKIVNQTYLRR